MSPAADDRTGTTPAQLRLHVCGIALPSAFGLTSLGMTAYLCVVPDDDHNAMAVGFVLAAIFLGFAQLRTRRALRTGDPDQRAALLGGLRGLHGAAIGAALAGFAVSAAVVLHPPHQAASFVFLTRLSLWFATIVVPLIPVALWARRIPWLADPRQNGRPTRT